MSFNFFGATLETKTQGEPILTSKNLHKVNFIDLKKIVAEHGARQLGGQGITFTSDNPELQKFFDKMKTFNKLDDWFINIVEIANYWGAVFPIVDKLQNGMWSFAVAQPQIFQSVAQMDVQSFAATVYKQHSTGTGVFFERIHITPKTITKTVSTRTIPDGTTSTPIPKELLSYVGGEGTRPNPYGFINTYKFLNKPNRVMFSQYYRINADDQSVSHIPDLVNHLYRQMYKEAIFNKTRIIGSFRKAQLNKLKQDQAEVSTYLNDFFTLTNDSGEQNQSVALLMGDPKFDSYMNGITRLTDEYIKGCLYSPQNDSEVQQTQAETLFTKSKDIETTKFKRERYTELLYNILDDILTFEGFMTKEGDRPYSIAINENVVYNEIQLTNLVIEAIDADLLTHEEAIQKLRGVDPDSAEEIFKKIKTKNNEYVKQKVVFENEEQQDEKENSPKSASIDPTRKE